VLAGCAVSQAFHCLLFRRQGGGVKRGGVTPAFKYYGGAVFVRSAWRAGVAAAFGAGRTGGLSLSPLLLAFCGAACPTTLVASCCEPLSFRTSGTLRTA